MYLPLGTLFFHKVGTSYTSFLDVYIGLLYGKLHISTLTYYLIALGCFALAYYRRLRLEEKRVAMMHTQLAHANLEALKTQLQPHFLFNCLNNIAAVISSDPATAEKMIAHLGHLLRSSLSLGAHQQITLGEEIEFVSEYLELQQFRFQDRLKIKIELSPETKLSLVPALSLLPLVENAIGHGISELPEGGLVELTAIIQTNRLIITITNDVSLDQKQRSDGLGIGLTNTSERLTQMYGGKASFESNRTADGRFIVRIEIPNLTASTKTNSIDESPL